MRYPKQALVLAVLAAIATTRVCAGHVEGSEVNVSIIECYVPMERVQKTFKGQTYTVNEPKRPPDIRVRAISANVTPIKTPTVTSNNSCAQALHEYLSAGYELVRDVSLGAHVYMLTRQDEIPKRE